MSMFRLTGLSFQETANGITNVEDTRKLQNSDSPNELAQMSRCGANRPGCLENRTRCGTNRPLDLDAGQIHLNVRRIDTVMGRIERVPGRIDLDVRPIHIDVGRIDLDVGRKISLGCDEDCLWGGLIG